MQFVRSLLPCIGAAALLALLVIDPAAAQTVPVRIIAINDFHGHLETADNAIAVPDPANPSSSVLLRSGGAAFLATRIRELKAEQPRSVVVSAGDLIGASPLLSGLFHDEPTIEVMNAIGIDLNALGNHEFDHGVRHLQRLLDGGCAPPPLHRRYSCMGPRDKFAGARFAWLTANVIRRDNDQPLMPPTLIKTFDGVRIGFIGAVTRTTPGIVVPSGITGVRFISEAAALNRYAKELQAQGVQTIVAVVHEGGDVDGGINACRNPRGAIFDIARELDAAIGIVISGHTHRAYNCVIEGRVITQAGSFGRLVTVIDTEIDRATGAVVRERTRARNVPVPNGTDDNRKLHAAYPPLSADPEVSAIIEHYRQVAAPLANEAAGRITTEFDRRPSSGGDSALGRLVADAQLAATRDNGAQLAFTNTGGLRTDLRATGGNGVVTQADAFSSQPFGNNLVTLTLTGAQLKELLEQQWSASRPERARMLQPSRGFTYTWRASGAHGDRIVASSMLLDGRMIEPDRAYRITVNSYLADGGDSFRVLREGTDRVGGEVDVDALTAYLKAASATRALSPDRTPRISRH